METILHWNGLRHDIMVCGNPKAWFPMRVTYQREMKVELDRMGIENFMPMRYMMDRTPLRAHTSC